MRLATIIPFVFITTSLFSQTTVKSGPMLGYAEMRETLIWVQFEKTVEAQMPINIETGKQVPYPVEVFNKKY